MKSGKLSVYEIENIEDCIPEIEKMYDFKFENDDLESVKSFEELCELIIEKINKKNVESCTSQQAFYKLRNSLITTKIIEKGNLNIETKLTTLFPRKSRKALIEKVENDLKFKLDILKAPDFITIPLFVIGIISFVLLFFHLKVGFIGVLTCSLGLYLSNKLGNEISKKTVKELVEKITSENYLAVRRDDSTINKTELKKIITKWISENSSIEKGKLENATFE